MVMRRSILGSGQSRGNGEGEGTSASERGADALDLVFEIPALLCRALDIGRET